MSCSGLHCAGCLGGMALPVVPLAELYGVVWVAEHLVEVIAVSATCGVLAVAAVVALMRWTERREARHAVACGIWSRADVILGPTRTRFRSLSPGAGSPLESPAGRSAIAPPQVVNFSFYGADATRAAALIRNAIPGTAGDAATREE